MRVVHVPMPCFGGYVSGNQIEIRMVVARLGGCLQPRDVVAVDGDRIQIHCKAHRVFEWARRYELEVIE